MPFIKKILDKTISRPKSGILDQLDTKSKEMIGVEEAQSRISGETVSDGRYNNYKSGSGSENVGPKSPMDPGSGGISTKYVNLGPPASSAAAEENTKNDSLGPEMLKSNKHKMPSNEIEGRGPASTKICNDRGDSMNSAASGESADTVATRDSSMSNNSASGVRKSSDNLNLPTAGLTLEDTGSTSAVRAGEAAIANDLGQYAGFDVNAVEKKEVDIEHYEFSRTIGTGSFGRVRIARKISSNEFFAVKILRKSEVVRAKQVEHVNNERAVLAFCDCKFIVQLHGTCQDSINLYMFMEFVIGGELFSYLRKYRKFPSPVAKFYAAEVTLAFEYLHSHGLVYRDLKPENILLDARGHVKLTDMGFAKYVPNITWTLCGTPDYLAPEIIQAKGYGQAVDWYSLGILIFEMIAGYPPFYNKDHYVLYERIVNGRIHWPPEFDPSARNLVENLTTKDLTKRYGNLKNGVRDIKNHIWFQEVNWTKLGNLEIAAPLVPSKKHSGDTGNFDRYPESYDDFGNNSSSDIFRSRFVNF